MTNVLIIFTGGTLGMKPTPSGYEPAHGYLSSVLVGSTTFHDTTKHTKTLKAIRHTGEVELTGYTLPPSTFGGPITYAVLEYETLLDSSSIQFADWVKIARTIERNYKLYDGFVVIHGTDSMAYSTSMLSFLLEDLGKTVIFTGSQIPISRLRNDAQENLLSALLIAGHYVIPEVCLFFHHELFRGNRVTKINAIGFDAFSSPNCLPLATVGVNIDVHWQRIYRPKANKAFKVAQVAEVDVASVYIFPGIKGATLRALAKQPGLKGLVLHTFGSGNIPANEDLISAIDECSDSGIVIVSITQCLVGSVLPLYAAGAVLSTVGVVSGFDMTAECALTKLTYLLGSNNVDRRSDASSLISQNLRGEMTLPREKKAFEHGDVPSSVRHRLADLLCAIESNELALAKDVLDDDTINAVSAEGTTPLQFAVTTGNDRMVQLLLDHVTQSELSLILPSHLAFEPRSECRTSPGWTTFRVQNPPEGIDFSVVGLLASISGTLTAARVSLFAVSTFDTDWIMIKQERYETAIGALRDAGWDITEVSGHGGTGGDDAD
ncbi:Related to Lysophospholipase [Taphrina deformans PYCC 5710]|uniref:asparaginase n=1 Tax=Taphrina deformans (strain PYCC 5710 / ATCC 11124 / CBS 356.35 / IMI 108563 / JCM 9778 / NBRC 8474) TaxID=1097556 RepID=R4X987_TAPDE|nr:Related to Lysophospholipase [Taphrina deformans PYCC 5710]|eukprot:CCG82281.1 Related to Lysophospholipase [Taphrina deformans PYCC 5710]